MPLPKLGTRLSMVCKGSLSASYPCLLFSFNLGTTKFNSEPMKCVIRWNSTFLLMASDLA